MALSAAGPLQAPVITIEEASEESFTLSDISGRSDMELSDTASFEWPTSDHQIVQETVPETSPETAPEITLVNSLSLVRFNVPLDT